MLTNAGKKVLRIAALVCCCLLVTARVAAAQDATPTIVITYDPTVPQSVPAIEAMKAHLTGMAVHTLIEPLRQTSLGLSERLEVPGELASAHQAIGAFSIEVDKRGDILVFFTEPDGRSALVRRVSSESSEPGVLREEAAIVVRSLVQALLDGKRIGMTESATPDIPATVPTSDSGQPAEPAPSPTPPAEPPAPAPPTDAPSDRGDRSSRESRSPRFAANAGYIITKFASGGGLESGLVIGARWFALREGYVGGSYTFFPTMVSGNSSATVALARHPAEIVVGYERRAKLAPIVELSLLIDGIHRSTLETSSELQSTTDSSHVSVGGGLRAGLSWGPVEWLRAAARLGADLSVWRPVYVSRLGEAQTVLEPAFVRPRFELGVAIYAP